jgi:hypothetical protein
MALSGIILYQARLTDRRAATGQTSSKSIQTPI